jgi:hypothetical protein
MLDYILPRASERKLRLFAVACCRLIEDQIPANLRYGIEVVERYADGMAREEELGPIAGFRHLIPDPPSAVFAVICLGWAAARTPDFGAAVRSWSDMAYSEAHPWQKPTTWDFQVPWLRDIFGYLFRPNTLAGFDLQKYDILELAHEIYVQRAFEKMPTLAERLEEAGISDSAILSHFRTANHHVRGCWALDMVLGRS